MLPSFRYHPDPIATGNVEQSDAACDCCGLARGYIYSASVYCESPSPESLCPWCIADGSAAQKFAASFADDRPLREAGLPAAVVDEVTRRTPGYACWQQEVWLSCCGDACEFHGDASKEELEELKGEALERTLARWELPADDWRHILKRYQPAGDASVYKFKCRHCAQALYWLDFS